MSRPHRFHQENWPYFVTSATHGRTRLFDDASNAEALIECLLATRDKYGFQLLAYVVMPDHFHAVIVPAPRNTISQTMRFIKGTYARAHNASYGLNGSVWQASFFERIVRDEEGLEEIIAYVHHNPVRVGRASAPERYPFSSAFPGRPTDIEAYFRGQAECLPYGSLGSSPDSDDGALSRLDG